MVKIAFIQQEMREYIGTMLMSARLKEAGHEVEVFIIRTDEDFFTVRDFNPDIIGFSSTTISFKNDLIMAKRFKDVTWNYTYPFIIFGGAYPTYNPEEVIKHDCIDAVCIGEGLDAIVELADCIQDKNYYDMHKIQNLWFKNNVEKDYMDEVILQTGERISHVLVNYNYDLVKTPIRPISSINDWPRPDYALYYDKYPVLRNKPTKPVYIVRGCPYNCGFCYNPAYNEMYKNKGKIFQCMDVDKAISEIKWLKKTYGFKYLQFLSDNMTINKKWLRKFLKKYEIINEDVICKTELMRCCNPEKPFFMNCRANEVTKDIVKQLKESGCDRVDFGVEHGNDYIRNSILKRNMSDEQIIQCGKWFKEAGIRVQTTNIFGLPHENFKRAWESVELNRQFVPEISKACILQPFENTSVYNYAKENNILKPNMKYSGTTIQMGVKDNRSDESKIIIDDEKQVIRLSYLFDWFVKNKIPRWLGYIICSLPLSKLYKKYYAKIFKEHGRRYKGLK